MRTFADSVSIKYPSNRDFHWLFCHKSLARKHLHHQASKARPQKPPVPSNSHQKDFEHPFALIRVTSTHKARKFCPLLRCLCVILRHAAISQTTGASLSMRRSAY
jgi:hypothetical protein